MAQINCATLPDLGNEWPDPVGWRHDGKLLRIFADCAHVDGFDAVVLACEPTAELTRHKPPPLPEPFPVPDNWALELPPQDFGHGENGEISGGTFRLTPFLTLPELGYDSDNDDAYHEWRFSVAASGRTYQDLARPSHLLGAPSAVQNDPLEQIAWFARGLAGRQLREPADPALKDPANWQVLLHLASDVQLGFYYGGGAYTVVAPIEDLRTGSYDRAYALWQY